jgi:hypothetical protein
VPMVTSAAAPLTCGATAEAASPSPFATVEGTDVPRNQDSDFG